MKKALSLLLLTFTILLITGCSQNMSLTTPNDEIVIRKNVSLGESCWDEEYKDFRISDSDEIKGLFSQINEWKYKEDQFTQFDLCGYLYVITWNENKSIKIINNNYFYMDGKLYKLTSGDIDFLDDFEFEQKT